jgi:hypothetical protein
LHSTLTSFSIEPSPRANPPQKLKFFPAYFIDTLLPQIGAQKLVHLIVAESLSHKELGIRKSYEM